MPCLAKPCRASPRRVSPRPAEPCPALPRRAWPRRAEPSRAVPRQAQPCRAPPGRGQMWWEESNLLEHQHHKSLPCPAVPRRASPRLAQPGHASPCLATPRQATPCHAVGKCGGRNRTSLSASTTKCHARSNLDRAYRPNCGRNVPSPKVPPMSRAIFRFSNVQ